MPKKYEPMGDEMDSEAYGAPVTSPGEGTETEAKPSVDEENAMSDTALVPMKVLSPDGEPVKDGDEIMVQVVSVHGDEAIVRYAPKKAGSEEESESPAESGDYEKDFAEMDKG